MALLAFLPCSLDSLHLASTLDGLKNGYSGLFPFMKSIRRHQYHSAVRFHLVVSYRAGQW